MEAANHLMDTQIMVIQQITVMDRVMAITRALIAMEVEVLYIIDGNHLLFATLIYGDPSFKIIVWHCNIYFPCFYLTGNYLFDMQTAILLCESVNALQRNFKQTFLKISMQSAD